ncbi:E3 ubiquitin-protein ligase TRIM11-like [Antechinus flavipes]|uniref:E3 ubiquitin-protein ligase TRIM11-like n=1 Tax=Antechinus flavipes TaxID=38775 RepID=UPI0022354A66|nr:E3 ubiquitin-protein ligase TRIM11-like [Antechinus flavipes]
MAATVEILKKMQSEITCRICRDYFCEPVTIGCGHNFCQACLSFRWRIGAPAFSCPECRQVSQDKEIPVVNRRLAELTELGKHFSSKLLESNEEQSQCVTHKKPLKHFCEDDQTALCVTCCETPEHGAHKISSVQEAAHKYRRELQQLQIRLGKHVEEDEQLLDQMESPAYKWLYLFRCEKSKVHTLLEEEESRSLQRCKQEEKTRRDRLKQYRQSLQDLMLELQETRHQLNLDLLQDAKQLLRRCEAVLAQRVKAVIPVLEEYYIPGLIEILNKFRVDLTLDPTSAHSSVTVSEDRKSVKAGEGWQVETKFPDDFPRHYVLAEQSFSLGNQYWVVDVTQLSQWTLGIYTPHMRTKEGMEVNSAVILLHCVKKEGEYYLQTYPGSLNHRMKGPLRWIGVYLRGLPGTVVFYNVLRRTLIYRFSALIFRGPVTPVFSPGPPLPGTNPGPMTLFPADAHLCACCHSRV